MSEGMRGPENQKFPPCPRPIVVVGQVSKKAAKGERPFGRTAKQNSKWWLDQ